MKQALTLGTVLAITVFSGRCLGQRESHVIPYQGFIADQSGQMGLAKSLNLIFRLYDTPVQGKVQWEEVQPDVAIVAGRFTVLLGSRSLLPNLLFFNKMVYLGVTVDDGIASTVDIRNASTPGAGSRHFIVSVF